MRTMRKSAKAIIVFSLTALSASVEGLGGSNVFGLFRNRLLMLEEIQDWRERYLERHGWAGPHGTPLSGDDVVASGSQISME